MREDIVEKIFNSSEDILLNDDNSECVGEYQFFYEVSEIRSTVNINIDAHEHEENKILNSQQSDYSKRIKKKFNNSIWIFRNALNAFGCDCGEFKIVDAKWLESNIEGFDYFAAHTAYDPHPDNVKSFARYVYGSFDFNFSFGRFVYMLCWLRETMFYSRRFSFFEDIYIKRNGFLLSHFEGTCFVNLWDMLSVSRADEVLDWPSEDLYTALKNLTELDNPEIVDIVKDVLLLRDKERHNKYKTTE